MKASDTAGVPALKPVIGEITPDSIAARAGLRFEDQILEVGGEPTPTWEAATLAILEDLTDNGTINLQVRGVDGANSVVSGQRRLRIHSVAHIRSLRLRSA